MSRRDMCASCTDQTKVARLHNEKKKHIHIIQDLCLRLASTARHLPGPSVSHIAVNTSSQLLTGE